MKQKLTTETFTERANNTHMGIYSYNITEPVNQKTKIDIICKTHGAFKQRIDHHFNGSGCPKCFGRDKDNLGLIESFKTVHGDRYDYSLVEYKNAKTKIKIICLKHGEFEVCSRHHLKGVNCSRCEKERISVSQRKTTDEFIFRAKATHDTTYDYSLTKYLNAITPVSIICKAHGAFEQLPRKHVNGTGCPICKESKGERVIRQFLQSKNISFKQEHKFPECKNLRPLPFDFFLPEFNTCIEFQGEQHYTNKNFFGSVSRLDYIKNNDAIKVNYCFENNINLCIISYKQFNEISDILQNYLFV